MRRAWRELRRAPGRIVASVFAIALAVGAVGVLAIPTVSERSLHEAVARDGLADITLFTTTVTPDTAARVAALPGVTALDRELDVGGSVAVEGSGTPAPADVRIVGLDRRDQQLDLLRLTAGRLPGIAGEVVVSEGVAHVGDRLQVTREGAAPVVLDVVGVGGTLWWSDTDAVFGDVDDLVARLARDGANRLTLTTAADDIDTLRTTAERAREVLRDAGTTLTDFPVYLPDGTTPIDEDIRQVSTLIGLLGVVAGVVALVLLGSTTSTLITERTREVAVMRALGAPNRRLRRRLRRISLGITAAALVLGLPLGVLISNLIARMVLEKFVGITPDIAVSWPVIAGSTGAALVGARLVAARAARRVTALPLAEALRDREGAPFGRRASERIAARVRIGGLRTRLATRASLHRRSRAVSMVAQVAVAVGALVVITGLTRSVNDYNAAAREPWSWSSRALALDPGLPFTASEVEAASTDVEAGVYVSGELDDRDIDVYGLRPDTRFFDPRVRYGRWIAAGQHEAVLSDAFAQRRGIAVGDTIDLELATGAVHYLVVGTADDSSRSVYVDRTDLATDLARPGSANMVWAATAVPEVTLPASAEVATADEIADADAEGRAAIVVIFGTIGAIVAGVAALAVISTLTVNLYERRHELATLQSLGAARRRVRGLLARELLPLGAVGVGLGLVAGWFGTRGIIASFEASNEVDIGASFAADAVAPIVVGTALALLLLAAHAVRRAGRRPIAVVLRGAA